MNRRLLALIAPCLAAAVLAAAPSLLAQVSASTIAAPAPVTEPALPSTTPLAITISPAPVPAGEAPLFVTITLTNTSDHDVRLPEPEIGCSSPRSGSVAIEAQFSSPAPEAAPEAAAGQSPASEFCFTAADASPAEAAAANDNPAAHWLTLAPGDAANFAQRIPSAGSGAPATSASASAASAQVVLRGTYTPPQVSPTAAERLYSLSVSYPTEPLTSAPVTVRGHAALVTTAGLFQ
jgi:hypothetical protein